MQINLPKGLPLGFFLLLVGSSVLADEAAGTIKKVKGTVTISRNNSPIAASPGAVVMATDQLVTGLDSTVGITLKDDTLLSYGPNSKIRLDDFKFDPTTHEGNLLISVIKGSMVFVTGLIGKKSPQSVAIKVSNTTIGIRGTEFIVEVEGE